MLNKLNWLCWLSFAKLRANYAEVGNDTDPYRVIQTYQIEMPFQGTGVANNNGTLNNPDLKPERTKSYEIGLEANFFNRRIGFDVSYYNMNVPSFAIEIIIVFNC